MFRLRIYCKRTLNTIPPNVSPEGGAPATIVHEGLQRGFDSIARAFLRGGAA